MIMERIVEKKFKFVRSWQENAWKLVISDKHHFFLSFLKLLWFDFVFLILQQRRFAYCGSGASAWGKIPDNDDAQQFVI